MKPLFVAALAIIVCAEASANCNKYQPLRNAHELREDVVAVTRECKKFAYTHGVPILADYKTIPDGDEALQRDLTSYTQGMNNDDARLTISQLVEKYGYNFEEHDVRTKDGYFLTLHRIRSSNSGNKVSFLAHGLYGSSADWLLNGKDSLPFMLAAEGYDVWLGNFRGNKYSIAHESLTPECIEYWDFTFDEFGLFDLPASIDYVRETAGLDKISYIGHSVGTTAFFVMASLLPDYNDRISSMIALSPMAWGANMKSPLPRIIDSDETLLRKATYALGPYSFYPSDMLTNNLKRFLCENNQVSQIVCNQLIFMITGFNTKLLNFNNFYAISQHYPAGGSTKTLLHISQNSIRGQFRRYDHPTTKANIDKYGFINPPDYPVENIRTNVLLFVSPIDYLSNITDVQKLRNRLPNVKDVVSVDDYTSIDFLWATNVKDAVFSSVVNLVKRYS